MIVTILILERACRYALESMQSHSEALDRAYSLLMASNTYDALIEQFPTDQTYSNSQFLEFILNHCL